MLQLVPYKWIKFEKTDSCLIALEIKESKKFFSSVRNWLAVQSEFSLMVEYTIIDLI